MKAALLATLGAHKVGDMKKEIRDFLSANEEIPDNVIEFLNKLLEM